jgi:Icc-related predicted phosphoesterase
LRFAIGSQHRSPCRPEGPLRTAAARSCENAVVNLLIFSDIHGDYGALARLMEQEADYYIAAGDLTNWGRGLERSGEILKRRAGQVYVLPGNHERAGQIAAFCAEYGLNDFHGKSFKAGGYHVAGLGYSNPTPFHTPGEYSEQEMAEHLKPFAGLKPLILICHCPPIDTPLDRVRDGMHAGSSAVRSFIERHQPEYFFCGHIHEAAGAEAQLGKTRGVNAGKRGFLLDIE